MRNLPLAVILSIATICGCIDQNVSDDNNWIELFNGRDLTGWTPKFSGKPLGDNYLETFRVQDSMLVVSYENWDSLRGVFGHLYFETAYSSYHIKAEYRFIGDQVAGGPGWAFANNGLMLHCQDPETIALDQDFPLSLEFQFLGTGHPGEGRPTGNLCTPGSHVEVDDVLKTEHCLQDFKGPSIQVGEWVTAEAYVYQDSLVHHIVNGDTVLTYTSPVVGGSLDGLDTTRFKNGEKMTSGFIAIQAESHGIMFRSILVKDLFNQSFSGSSR